jgi:hypothetical protein
MSALQSISAVAGADVRARVFAESAAKSLSDQN